MTLLRPSLSLPQSLLQTTLNPVPQRATPHQEVLQLSMPQPLLPLPRQLPQKQKQRSLPLRMRLWSSPNLSTRVSFSTKPLVSSSKKDNRSCMMGTKTDLSCFVDTSSPPRGISGSVKSPSIRSSFQNTLAVGSQTLLPFITMSLTRVRPVKGFCSMRNAPKTKITRLAFSIWSVFSPKTR